jgi:hypothetical protein
MENRSKYCHGCDATSLSLTSRQANEQHAPCPPAQPTTLPCFLLVSPEPSPSLTYFAWKPTGWTHLSLTPLFFFFSLCSKEDNLWASSNLHTTVRPHDILLFKTVHHRRPAQASAPQSVVTTSPSARRDSASHALPRPV